MELLRHLNACSDAQEWAENQPDLRTAWEQCHRADWMIWLAATLLPRPIVVLASCDCADTSLHLIADGGKQMAAIFALHVAREWAEGRETDPETVQAAAADAACAFVNYEYDAAYSAAFAAAASAAAAAAKPYAAISVVDADAATAAASAAADAQPGALALIADLVRARISADVICAASAFRAQPTDSVTP